MTQKELFALALLTKKDLVDIVRGESVPAILRFRREVQEAVAYRRKLNGQGPDTVQDAGINATMILERYARHVAWESEFPKILRRQPELMKQGPNAAKVAFKEWWEPYLRSQSY